MVFALCREGKKADNLLQELVTVSQLYFTVLLLAKTNTVFSGYNEHNRKYGLSKGNFQLLKFCCILRVAKRKVQETELACFF